METRLADCVYALHASREEQGLCPHVKNPAFNAGLVFLCLQGRYYLNEVTITAMTTITAATAMIPGIRSPSRSERKPSFD